MLQKMTINTGIWFSLGILTLYEKNDEIFTRAYWRELYSVEEAEHLTNLINAAKESNITFMYALSPGRKWNISTFLKATCNVVF